MAEVHTTGSGSGGSSRAASRQNTDSAAAVAAAAAPTSSHGDATVDVVGALFALTGTSVVTGGGSRTTTVAGGGGGGGGGAGVEGGEKVGRTPSADNAAGAAEFAIIRPPAEAAAALLAPMSAAVAGATWMVHVVHPRRGGDAAHTSHIAAIDLCVLSTGEPILHAERFVRPAPSVTATPVVEYVICSAKAGTPLLQVRRAALVLPDDAPAVAYPLPHGVTLEYAVLALPPPRSLVPHTAPVPHAAAPRGASHATHPSPAAGAGGAVGVAGDGEDHTAAGADGADGERKHHSKLTRGRRGRIVGLTVLTVARFLSFTRAKRAAAEAAAAAAAAAAPAGEGGEGGGEGGGAKASTTTTTGAAGAATGGAGGGGGESERGSLLETPPKRDLLPRGHASEDSHGNTSARPSLVHAAGMPLHEAYELAEPPSADVSGLPLPLPLRNQNGAVRVVRAVADKADKVLLTAEAVCLAKPAAVVASGHVASGAGGALAAALRGTAAGGDAPLLSLQPLTPGDPDALALRVLAPLSLAQAAALAIALVDACVEPLQ